MVMENFKILLEENTKGCIGKTNNKVRENCTARMEL